MRSKHLAIGTAPRRMWRQSLGLILGITTLGGLATAAFDVVPASAALTGAVFSAQSPTAVPPTGSSIYTVTVSGGGGIADYVKLTSNSGLPTGATFSDTTDGCKQESAAGVATFPTATVTTAAAALGTTAFQVGATEYSESTCTTAVPLSTATANGSLVVGNVPTLTYFSTTSTTTAGTTIPNTSILLSVTGGQTSTGTVAFSVAGPFTTSTPSSCIAPSQSLGSLAITGNNNYNPPSGFTPTAVGNYFLYATYGGDLADGSAVSNCNLASAEIIVTIGASPVTWAAPAAIPFGTALSATQLNASSGSVAGTLAYTPPIGTVLGAGTTTLAVLFTPTDTIDYMPITITTPIVVTPAPLVVTASSSTVAYGYTPTAVSPTITGFVNGNSSTALATQPTCTTNVTSASAPGVHAGSNTCSGATGVNYAVSYASGNVTVTAPAVTVSMKLLTITSAHKTTVKVTCAATGKCAGTVSLSIGKAVYGSKTYSIAAGSSSNVTITLNTAGKKFFTGVTASKTKRVVLKTTVTAGTTRSATVKAK